MRQVHGEGVWICDFVSYISYLYLLKQKSINTWANRLSWLTIENVEEILEILKPSLNVSASRNSDYGLVVYPK